MSKKKLISIFSLMGLTIFSFQNCSESSFRGIDPAMKLETLGSHSGLGTDPLDQRNNQNDNGLSGISPQNDGGLTINPNSDNGINGWPHSEGGRNTGGPQTFNPGMDPVTNPTEGRFHVIRWCRGKDKGATLTESKVVQILVKDEQKVICQAQGENLLKQIVETGQVQIPGCDFSNIPNRRMVVEVTNESGKNLADGDENTSGKNAFDDKKVKSDDDRQKFDAVALHLLLERNLDKKDAGKCDAYNSSPLVVDMRNESELVNIFTLTSPSGGVLFDIEGSNATPAPHTKKQISWMTDPRIMPIVLPNRGGVDGIDELFGDNTRGPDGRFAENGFKALKKYDDNNDGYITEEDPIFEKLRVWYDRDLNGISQSNELYSLDRANITAIDLTYDPNFYSQDKYGNEIKYKSVVQLKNGKLKPVFDIWFTVNNMIQN